MKSQYAARGLIYLAHLYEGYVSKNKLNLYGTRMISLPTPRYIVLYSGIRKEPDYKEYHLTDSFADKDSSCLECTAVVLNVNTGHNQKILAQCQLLNEYACFLETVRNYTDEPSYTMNEAIDLAVTECIRKGILSDLLSKHRAEVINVLLTEYDADLHMKATYEEGREEGFLEGRQAGLAEGRQAGIAEGRQAGITEGRQAGLSEGRQAGIQILISSNKKNGISKETTVHDLILNFSLSESQAAEYMNQYW